MRKVDEELKEGQHSGVRGTHTQTEERLEEQRAMWGQELEERTFRGGGRKGQRQRPGVLGEKPVARDQGHMGDNVKTLNEFRKKRQESGGTCPGGCTGENWSSSGC